MKQHSIRLLLTNLITAVALAAAITNASASRLSISNRNIRVTWTSLELSNTTTTEIIRCPVTLEGSFTESTIRKVLRALIGVISRASVTAASCTGGTVTIRQESLPWRYTYDGFTGTLPRIQTVRALIVRLTFEIHTQIATCTDATTEESPAVGNAVLNETTGAIDDLEAESGARIPARGGLCGLGELSLASSGPVTQLGNTTRITIKLI